MQSLYESLLNLMEGTITKFDHFASTFDELMDNNLSHSIRLRYRIYKRTTHS